MTILQKPRTKARRGGSRKELSFSCLRAKAIFWLPKKETALISSIRAVVYVGSGGRT
ncbi:MAG: hypothetical protein WCL28_00290 [bacterium]